MTKRRKSPRVNPAPTVSPAVIAELDAIYAELPQIDCIGQCWDSCSRIFLTKPEQARAANAGVPLESDMSGKPSLCPALTMLKQCSIYDVRPLICRLWGLTEDLSCNYGCRPKNRPLLSTREQHEYLARVYDIAGDHDMASNIRELWEDPVKAQIHVNALRREREDENLRLQQERARIERSGKPQIYVLGPGRLSRTPPPSGANSKPGR